MVNHLCTVAGNFEYESFPENVIGFVNVLDIAGDIGLGNIVDFYLYYHFEFHHLYFADYTLICGWLWVASRVHSVSSPDRPHLSQT